MERPTPRLICLDMDGTLYQDRVIYPRIIDYFFTDTPYEIMIPRVKILMEALLGGKMPFQCGHFAPKTVIKNATCAEDLFPIGTSAALLEPDPSPWLNRSRWSYICEGWTLAMYLSRRIGWGGGTFWNIFQQARNDLLSEELGPLPDVELKNILHTLHAGGTRLILCSNARTEAGMALLARLALVNCFDEIIFDADKPQTIPERVANWSARWGISPEEMLFVGDQGYFDLYAGMRLGGRTLLLSPYQVADASLWDQQVSSLDEFKAFLRAEAKIGFY